MRAVLEGPIGDFQELPLPGPIGRETVALADWQEVLDSEPRGPCAGTVDFAAAIWLD
ncbi:hypothetical protein L6Q96_12255 [Candidatus Binatia bacterium]|nr:hypothetical protein [Candidatus Binatia bacterium]